VTADDAVVQRRIVVEVRRANAQLTDVVAAVAAEVATHGLGQGLAGDLHLDGGDEVVARVEGGVDGAHVEPECLGDRSSGRRLSGRSRGAGSFAAGKQDEQENPTAMSSWSHGSVELDFHHLVKEDRL